MDFSGLVVSAYGAALILGTWVAYGMQTFRIVYTRRGDGVSPTQPALNYAAACFLTMEVLILKGSEWFQPVAEEASVSSILQTLPFFQIAVSMPLSVILLGALLAVTRTWEALLCALGCIVHTAGVVVGAFVLLWTLPEWLFVYGQFCGLMASATTTVTWIPEIVLVWRHRSTGELSIIFVAFEFVGSVTTVLYQALPWLGNEPWTAWMPEFILFIQQFILVSLWVYFNRPLMHATKTVAVAAWSRIRNRPSAPVDVDPLIYGIIDFQPPWSDEPE